jgi:hypothetical protein
MDVLAPPQAAGDDPGREGAARREGHA